MTTKKKPKAKTQEQLDAEDAAIKENLRQESVKKMIDPVLNFLQENAQFAEMQPERIAFVLQLLKPKDERGSFEDLAKLFKVSVTTLYNWQHNDLVRELRGKLMPLILQTHTPDVVNNLARLAKDRSPDANPVPAIKLWLQYVEEWKETQKVEGMQPVFNFGFPPSQFIQLEKKPKKKNA